jgi:hypothetical protein
MQDMMKAEDLIEGGLYVVVNKKGGFNIAKVMCVVDIIAYVRCYGNVFHKMPTESDIGGLSMEKIHEGPWPIACVPILASGFQGEALALVCQVAVTSEEIDSVREVIEMQEDE